MSMWSFRRLHPNWKINLFFMPQSQETVTREWSGYEHLECERVPIQPCYLDRLKGIDVAVQPWIADGNFPVPVQADLCRWKVLRDHGGWFADTDFLFVDSIESIHGAASSSHFSISIGQESAPTGIIGSVKNSGTSQALAVASRSFANRQHFSSAGEHTLRVVAGVDSLVNFDRLAFRVGLEGFCATADERVYFIKPVCFYQWSEYHVTDVLSYSHEVAPSTIAIHWYGSSRLSQRIVREVNHTNHLARRGTLFEYARDLTTSSPPVIV